MMLWEQIFCLGLAIRTGGRFFMANMTAAYILSGTNGKISGLFWLAATVGRSRLSWQEEIDWYNKLDLEEVNL